MLDNLLTNLRKNKTLKNLFYHYTILILLRHTVLLYFILTDVNYYNAQLPKTPVYNIGFDLFFIRKMPILIYMVFAFFLFKLTFLTKLQVFFCFILAIFLYFFIDIRDILFFIDNHRLKLYVAITIEFLFLVQYFFMLKKNNEIKIDNEKN